MVRAADARNVALLLSLGALVACRGAANRDKEHGKKAVDAFSRQFSCPEASVTVTPRRDLKAYDLQVTPSSPAAEVAADPARLAEWNRREAKVREGYESMTVQHASGCGHALFYVCSPATSSNGEQVVACSTASHPPK
jgi:hypothetical protein